MSELKGNPAGERARTHCMTLAGSCLKTSQRRCAALAAVLPVVVLGCGTPLLGLSIEHVAELCEARGFTRQHVLRRVARASLQRRAFDWGREGVEEGRQRVTENGYKQQGGPRARKGGCGFVSNLDERHK